MLQNTSCQVDAVVHRPALLLHSVKRPRPAPPVSRGQPCNALRDKITTVSRTVARRPKVDNQEDFANTPDRRYVFFTGFPFPIGPLLYRKTSCKEVRVPPILQLWQSASAMLLCTVTFCAF